MSTRYRVGPVHAGLTEPGHFRFSVVGEAILMKARLWFVYRGIEKLFEGRHPADCIELTERISGDTAVGHTLAFANAVEQQPASKWPRKTGLFAPCCWSWNGFTTMSPTLVPSPTTSDSASSTPTPSACGRRCSGSTRRPPAIGCCAAVTIGGARLTALPDLDVVTTVAREVEELRAITLGKSTVRDRFTGTRGTQPRSSPQPRHAGLRGPRLRGRHRCPQGPSIRRTRRTLRGCA